MIRELRFIGWCLKLIVFSFEQSGDLCICTFPFWLFVWEIWRSKWRWRCKWSMGWCSQSSQEKARNADTTSCCWHSSGTALMRDQHYCLLFCCQWKKWPLIDSLCVSCLIFTTQIELSECCVWFQCITQWRCSHVSNVVCCWFDGNGKKCFADGYNLAFVSFTQTRQIEFCKCCVWSQCITQWCCSCVSNVVACWFDESRKEWFLGKCFLCVVSFVFTSEIKLRECCVWFQCIAQWCCSRVSNPVACSSVWR